MKEEEHAKTKTCHFELRSLNPFFPLLVSSHLILTDKEIKDSLLGESDV